jgi:hypothetical protein
MIRRWQRNQTDRFSAHDHAPVFTAAFPQPGDSSGEGGCKAVVRIVPKAAHSPTVI